MKSVFVLAASVLLGCHVVSAQTNFNVPNGSAPTPQTQTLNDTVEVREINGKQMKFMYKTVDGRTLTVSEKTDLFKKFGSLGQRYGRSADGIVITLYTPESKDQFDSLVSFINKDRASKSNAFAERWMNKPIDNLALTDLAGKSYTMESLKGTVVVLNFWFTTCGPCINEMPVLNTVAEEYKGKKVVFLAIGLDSKEKVEAFLKNTPFNYQHVPSQKINTDLAVYAWPTHMVVDKKGIIRFIQVGGENIREKLEKNIELAMK